MPEPYIFKVANQLIRAADWNDIQILARTDIQSHNHSGGEQGVQLGTDAIADGSITAAKLASEIDLGLEPGAVGTEHIADGAVTANKLASDIDLGLEPGAVGTEHIADGAVTASKLADDVSIGVEPGAIGTEHIADGAVTASKLADDVSVGVELGSVNTPHLSDQAVTLDKLAVDVLARLNAIEQIAIEARDLAQQALNRADSPHSGPTHKANGALSLIYNKVAPEIVRLHHRINGLPIGGIVEVNLPDLELWK